MDYIIRQANYEDIPNIINLNKAVLPDFWYNTDYYEILIQDFNEIIYVAEMNKNIIGYILCKIDYTSLFLKNKFFKKGYIISLGVDKIYRKKHIATRLIEKCMSSLIDLECEECSLHTKSDNKEAEKLYIKMGFQKVGIEKNYYRRFFKNASVYAIDLTKQQSTSQYH